MQQDRARVFQLEPVAKLLRQAAELYDTALIDVAERHPKLYFTSAIPAALQSLTPAQRGWTPCRAPAFRHAAQRGSQAFTDGAIKGEPASGTAWPAPSPQQWDAEQRASKVAELAQASFGTDSEWAAAVRGFHEYIDSEYATQIERAR